jgi:hypothetical protein
MTREEYNRWYQDLARRAPSLQQFVEQVADPNGTMACWFDDVFSHLDLADCIQVNLALCTGDLEKPWGGDLPAFFRNETRKIAYHRNERRERARLRREAISGPGAWQYVQSSMAAAYQRARAIIQEEIKAGQSWENAVWIMGNSRERGGRREEWVSLMET